MKGIDELIEKYEKLMLVNELEVLQDLKVLKEQHKKDVMRAYFKGGVNDYLNTEHRIPLGYPDEEEYERVGINYYKQNHEQ